MAAPSKPLVLITGMAGRLGTALVERLRGDYRVAGFDVKASDASKFHTGDSFVIDGGYTIF